MDIKEQLKNLSKEELIELIAGGLEKSEEPEKSRRKQNRGKKDKNSGPQQQKQLLEGRRGAKRRKNKKRRSGEDDFDIHAHRRKRSQRKNKNKQCRTESMFIPEGGRKNKFLDMADYHKHKDDSEIDRKLSGGNSLEPRGERSPFVEMECDICGYECNAHVNQIYKDDEGHHFVCPDCQDRQRR